MNVRSAKRQAYRNEAAIRGMRSDGGSGAKLWHLAQYLPCHSAAPPPVQEYERWLAQSVSVDARGKTRLTGPKLRRAVVMRRNGNSTKETASAVGIAPHTLSTWLAKLPPELAV